MIIGTEEVKSPNRAEKRPIDSTSSDEPSAAGLQVTGAPVPLFAAQDVSATNIGIQVQGSVVANGPTAQCVAGITFQPVPGTTCPTFPATNGQVVPFIPNDVIKTFFNSLSVVTRLRLARRPLLLSPFPVCR